MTLQLLQFILSSIVLPLSGWTLLSVVNLGNRDAANREWRIARDHEIVELRARVVACEEGLDNLRFAFAAAGIHEQNKN